MTRFLRSNIERFVASCVLCGGLFGLAEATPTYFENRFDDPVPIGPTQAQGVWYTDRYAPAAFERAWFQGDNRLRIGISSLHVRHLRPPPFNDEFYDTHGRKFDLGNGLYTSIRGKLYVGTDWATQARRSDIWGVTVDAGNYISGYPILGFANPTGTPGGLVLRWWTQDIDQNPVGGYQYGWVDLTSRVPGGLTTDRWYDLEIELTPSAFKAYVDGVLVYVDDFTFESDKFSSMFLQAFNFPGALNSSYDVYWDDVAALPAGGRGLPVDLNGRYIGVANGFATARTQPGVGRERPQVLEFSHDWATDGTFTPFSDGDEDDHKRPKTMEVDLRGKSYQFELDIHDHALWAGGAIPSTRDHFAVFAGSDVDSTDTLPAVGVIVTRVAETTVRIYAASSYAVLGDYYLPNANETRFLVNVEFEGNLEMKVSVTPLNGTNAGITDVLTPLPLTIGVPVPRNNDDVSNIGFCVGWSNGAPRSTAKATISKFTTTAAPNVLYAFSEDPYAKPGEMFSVMVGHSNLGQPVTGYQAFLYGSGAGATFNPASDYNRGFYSQFVPPTIGAALNLAGATTVPTTFDMDVAEILLNAVSQSSNFIGFRPNTGAEVNLFAGDPPFFSDVPALTLDSNRLIVDGTPPTLSVPALSGTALVGVNTIVQGTLGISVLANDPVANDSGLADRPTGWITWSNGTVTPLLFHSWIGQEFLTSLLIGPSTPMGPATLTVRVCDDAGNCTTQTRPLFVNVAQLTLTVNAAGIVAPVSRIVDVVVGGTGGTQSAVTLYTDLNANAIFDTGEAGLIANFNASGVATLNLTAAHGLPATNNLTAISVKDRFFSLQTLVQPSGPVANGSFTSGGSGQYTGTVNLWMGDVTHNNVVNVADLAVWASQNQSPRTPATNHGTPLTPRNAELTANGQVDLYDRNVITAAWLRAGDGTPGAFAPLTRGGIPRATDRMTVRDLVEEGVPKDAATAMDLNRDRWVTVDEINRWVRQRR